MFEIPIPKTEVNLNLYFLSLNLNLFWKILLYYFRELFFVIIIIKSHNISLETVLEMLFHLKSINTWKCFNLDRTLHYIEFYLLICFYSFIVSHHDNFYMKFLSKNTNKHKGSHQKKRIYKDISFICFDPLPPPPNKDIKNKYILLNYLDR